MSDCGDTINSDHTSDAGRNSIGGGDGGGVNGDDNNSNDGDNNDSSNVGDGSSDDEGGDCNNGSDGNDSGDDDRGIQNRNIELRDIDIEHFLLRTLKNKVTFGWSREETLVQLRSVCELLHDNRIPYSTWYSVIRNLKHIGYQPAQILKICFGEDHVT